MGIARAGVCNFFHVMASGMASENANRMREGIIASGIGGRARTHLGIFCYMYLRMRPMRAAFLLCALFT
jgi:hypothetical protein